VGERVTPRLSVVVSESGIGIILLAAGESSRMGEPKQLLRYEGETLLSRAVRVALETLCRPIVVVLGARAEDLRREIEGTGALAVFNQSWEEGMSSSIRCGLRAMEEAARGDVEAIVLMLCDQPHVESNVIERLVEAYRASRAPVVASEYGAGTGKTLGAPALFSRALFAELMALSGAEGAKRVITRHASRAVAVAVPEAAFDVDTPDDYARLERSQSDRSD
jgi:molybdenum cofactor cytidylyltransferase